ncbi:MAG: NUDIX hydrolase [Phycisphaerales bacterium]|nr:NUDIX hydrolase [Phycisphaerales bacterium]
MTRNSVNEIVHSGRIFNVEVVHTTDRDGTPIRRDIVRHKGAVLIVPVLADGRLVMIRNYRIAVDDRLWEFPAGGLEVGEDPQRAAGRELEEETGYRAASIELLGSFYTSPGFADEFMRAYVATGLTEVGQRLEPGEDIEVQRITPEQLLNMIDDNTIVDGKTIAAGLMWHRRFGGGSPG